MTHTTKTTEKIKKLIQECSAQPELLKQKEYQQAITYCMEQLTNGKFRIATHLPPTKRKSNKTSASSHPLASQWKVHSWLKEAILLYFQTMPMRQQTLGEELGYYDKIPLQGNFKKKKFRVVPPAVIRYGAHVEQGAIIMPSFINIGAYVGKNTLIDTWATVGSCAQIGKSVHLSGGVGIGGVIEPIQSAPVIVEDHAFIGSRVIVVEGVLVEEGAVLAAGVVLTGSTPIIDVTQSREIQLRRRIPAGSVVIPGSRSKNFPAGAYSTPAALIIGKRNENTDRKTSLEQVIRDYSISLA